MEYNPRSTVQIDVLPSSRQLPKWLLLNCVAPCQRLTYCQRTAKKEEAREWKQKRQSHTTMYSTRSYKHKTEEKRKRDWRGRKLSLTAWFLTIIYPLWKRMEPGRAASEDYRRFVGLARPCPPERIAPSPRGSTASSGSACMIIYP